MLLDLGLNEKGGHFRVKPNGNPIDYNVIGGFSNNLGVGIFAGQGMPVRYEIKCPRCILPVGLIPLRILFFRI